MKSILIPNDLSKGFVAACLYAVPVLGLMSCGQNPTREYDPSLKHETPRIEYTADMDMYRSPSYETYSENPILPEGMTAQVPAHGSIARGHMPYAYPNTPEGYEMAGQQLKNPVPLTEENLAEGKELFLKFCSHCHGKNGKGDGTIIKNDKFPAPPAYDSPALKDLPEGKMFHTITYGKNLMGSHASQLEPEQRWKIIHFIQTLQGPKASAESTGTAAAGSDVAPADAAPASAAPAAAPATGK